MRLNRRTKKPFFLLVVKDAGFGEIVYSGTFIGNTLVVALANSGESYTVEFV